MSENDELLNFDDSVLASLEPDIPPDPSPALIKKMLGEMPRQIEYLSTIWLEEKKQINQLKQSLKEKKQELERDKSKIRQETLRKYNEEIVVDVSKTVGQILERAVANNEKLTKMATQEIIKKIMPDKPTRSDLDDIANLETIVLQNDILAIENEISKREIRVDLLKAKVDRYENVYIAVRAHKSLIVEEMRRDLD